MSQKEFRVLSKKDFDPTAEGHKPRRIFTKTRSGCEACKLKKVKCDETRPECRRCQRNDRQCSFARIVQEQGLTTYNGSAPISANISVPRNALEADPVTAFPVLRMTNNTWCRHMLQHCQRHWKDIFPVANSEEIVGWAQSSELVRDTVVAVAATHLRTKAPWVRQHQVLEHLQLSSALEKYRSALNASHTFSDLHHTKAVLLCGTLLSLVAFSLPAAELSETGQYSVQDSWVFNQGKSPLGWMALQAGLRPLAISINKHREQSIADLGFIFTGDYDTRSFINHMKHPDLEYVAEHWIKVFELSDGPSEKTCESSNPYRLPAIVLSNLRSLEANEHSAYLYLMTLGKMNLEFRGLAAQGDARAVWLVGYWLGLMCQFSSLWWCEQRARRDYQAICSWFIALGTPRLPKDEQYAWDQLMEDLHSLALRP